MPKVRIIGNGVVGRELGDTETVSDHEAAAWISAGSAEVVPEAAEKAVTEKAVRPKAAPRTRKAGETRG